MIDVGRLALASEHLLTIFLYYNRTLYPDPVLLRAGAAGFQLINVNAVPLALGGWSTSTQLASRKALTATLTRHYRDEFIKEAHKVSPTVS